MGSNEVNAIREWIVDRTVEVVTNDPSESLYRMVLEMAADHEDAESVGAAFQEWLADEFRTHLPDGLREIVLDVFDLSDSRQAEMFGKEFKDL